MIKFVSLVADSTTNERKAGQSIKIGNSERVSEALASTCKTSQHSFETDSVVQIYRVSQKLFDV